MKIIEDQTNYCQNFNHGLTAKTVSYCFHFNSNQYLWIAQLACPTKSPKNYALDKNGTIFIHSRLKSILGYPYWNMKYDRHYWTEKIYFVLGFVHLKVAYNELLFIIIFLL